MLQELIKSPFCIYYHYHLLLLLSLEIRFKNQIVQKPVKLFRLQIKIRVFRSCEFLLRGFLKQNLTLVERSKVLNE